MTGKFSAAGYTADRTPTVTFEIPGFDLQACDEWQGKDLDIEVKEHKITAQKMRMLICGFFVMK